MNLQRQTLLYGRRAISGKSVFAIRGTKDTKDIKVFKVIKAERLNVGRVGKMPMTLSSLTLQAIQYAYLK
jgi:hypothetical protein